MSHIEKFGAMAAGKPPLSNIFTVDVEDWYHILDVPSAPGIEKWSALPARVESNFLKLLELFTERDVHVTCFFLGWIAEKFPQLVREAAGRGHEIASHGYEHRLVFQMMPAEFREDALRSRKTLEDICGFPVRGYRAAGFSSTTESPWFFEELAEAGYQYDSSIFPGKRGHGGLPESPCAPYVVSTSRGSIVEFPITLANCMGSRICFFGGGYLRLFPYWLIRQMSNAVRREGQPVIFYVHPREIDPKHPRLEMKLSRRFKSYVNLSSTQTKIRRILEDFSCTTFQNYLERSGPPANVVAADLAMHAEVHVNTLRPAQGLPDSCAGTVKEQPLCDWVKERNTQRRIGKGEWHIPS